MHEFVHDDVSREDQALLHELGEALAEAATVPPEALAAAKGAFTWRTIDADLARLTYDSAAEADARPVLRTSSPTRYLTFEVGGVRIDLEISAGRIVGQIDPPSYELLTAESAGGFRICAQVDQLGCFVLDHGPSGQVRFTLQGPSAAPVLSEWTAL
jgi:hypothetical protein